GRGGVDKAAVFHRWQLRGWSATCWLATLRRVRNLDDDFDWLLFAQDRLLTWRQACEHLTEDVVLGRVARGLWQRPCRGVVVAHNGPLTVAQREWAAVLAAGRGALLAGATAARLSGLRGYESPAIHVLVPACRRVDRKVYAATLPVVLHRTSVIGGADALWRGRPPQTTIARSLIDAAQWARSDDAARAIVAAGFQQRLVGLDEITATLDRMPRAKRRNLVLETALDAAGGAHSIAEIALVRLCRAHALPPPDQQERRRDRSGKRRWLDAWWPEWRLHVEIDGGHHTEVRQWWNDMQRQNALWIAGDRVLRFPSWAVRRRPDEVAAQIRAALTAAGWSPTPTPTRSSPQR
ncbi:MAG: endonuclease domain-containing protein, partial [Dehalococcoidia bacterium]